MQKQKVLGYFLYGHHQKYQLELFLSLLSALKHLRRDSHGVTISVVTDQPNLDPDLPIDILLISPEEFASWTNGGAYHHRAKCFALKKLLDHYQCPVVMVDTDTFFLKSPVYLFERISPAQTVMHCKETNAIGKLPSYQPLLERLGRTIDVDGVQISPSSPMYNSGVIGLDPSHALLVEKSITVLDMVYAAYPLFNVEQFAIGVVLDQYTKLTSSDDVVFHYWGYHRSFIHIQAERLFADFTANTLEKQLNASIPNPLGYPRMPLRDRLIARLSGAISGWNGDYRFAYLAYRCAFFYAAQDAQYANTWAQVALEILQKNTTHYQTIKQDFYRFKPNQLHQLSWLDPQIRTAWKQFWHQADTRIADAQVDSRPVDFRQVDS
ncbi:MAG: hypothetical protein MUF49_20040 [Oculatellaceae cyanobacterium Prado106]|jgi:hypothetical protein|nr:hypothetical protein [Oculatellaceae cyanobacterium Prado106]